MQKFTLTVFALFLSLFAVNAQTVATFDTLSLPKADTFYVNYNAYGKDVGFDDGLAHFPCVYDTSFGFEFWSYGFSYSNMRDTLTEGFGNQYAAITGKGFNQSSQYLVGYGVSNKVMLKGSAIGKRVNGFYVTNSTYAYFSMKNGDMFSKKFGGTTGNDSDWYKITIKGYSNGQLKPNDSVETFLADFRFQDNSRDTIINTWQWVNLLPLGNVDSLYMELSSSDVGAFGMNTPAYFCMDNFSTYETNSVRQVAPVLAAKVYPNPAVNNISVEAVDSKLHEIYIVNAVGSVVARQQVAAQVTNIDISAFAPGVYTLQLAGEGQAGSVRFIKQ